MGHQPNRFPVWDLIVLTAVAAAAIAVVHYTGLQESWANAVFYTAMVFTLVGVNVRAAWWKQPPFWRNLLLILAFHLLVVTVLVENLKVWPKHIPWLVFTVAMGVEGFVILAVLWGIHSKRNQSAARWHGTDRDSYS